MHSNGRNSITPSSSLIDLAEAIRALHQDVCDHMRSALRIALDAGDALNWAKDRVSAGGWIAWRTENCSKLSKKTDEVYRRLADHRAVIEQALERDPDLSIRDALKLIGILDDDPNLSIEDALKLIREPKPKASKSNSEPVDHWGALSPEAKTAGLERDGLETFLGYAPLRWRDDLADRVARVDKGRETVFDRHLTTLLRAYLKNHTDRDCHDALLGFIHSRGINVERLVVQVDPLDAPNRRRPPLVEATSKKVIAFPAVDRAPRQDEKSGGARS
jgi:hypothetical protein